MSKAELCASCTKQCKLRNALQASEKAIQNGRDVLRAKKVAAQIGAGEYTECTQKEAIANDIKNLNPAFDISIF